jgi:hypothetical protein
MELNPYFVYFYKQDTPTEFCNSSISAPLGAPCP